MADWRFVCMATGVQCVRIGLRTEMLLLPARAWGSPLIVS